MRTLLSALARRRALLLSGALLLLAALTGRSPAAAVVQAPLLQDIRPGAGRIEQPSGGPRGIMAIGNVFYFTDVDLRNGRELWKSDGTSAGTVLVRDIAPGTANTNQSPSDVGGMLYFNGALWKSDGTAQQSLSVPVSRSAHAGGTVFFVSSGSDEQRGALWKLDDSGSAVVVKNFGQAERQPYALTALGGALFFAVDDGAHGRELWKSDGSEAGTEMVAELNPSGDSVPADATLAAAGGRVFFNATDGSGLALWASDGTQGGTTKVSASPAVEARAAGDTLFFSTATLSSGAPPVIYTTALWKVDAGAPTATLLNSASDSSPIGAPRQLTAVGGALFFAGRDLTLWKSDGTPGGTAQLSPVMADQPAGNGSALYGGATRLYFVNNSSNGEQRVWTSDGTPSGTQVLKDTNPIGPDSPSNIAVSGDVVLFTARDENNHTMLWKSDGTAAGTQVLRDSAQEALGSIPDYLIGGYPAAADPVIANGRVLFVADDGAHGAELWASDGTTAGAVLLKDINPSGAANPSGLLAWKNRGYWLASSGSAYALWSSDGTPGGTAPVRQLNTDSFDAGQPLVVHGGALYFFGAASNGYHLWKSDGTAAGTTVVATLPRLNSGTADQPAELASAGGRLFFSYQDTAHGREVWTSDGTQTGTKLLKNIRDTSDSSEPFGLRALNGRLVFAVLFGPNSAQELWVSDGTEAGTQQLKTFESRTSPGPDNFTVVGRQLFFSSFDSQAGVELWTSDGTAAGTRRVKDINTLPNISLPVSDNKGSNPRALAAFNGRLLFSADDGVHGQELWISDGTAAGTRLVQDIMPGAGDSGIWSIREGGAQAIFGASSGPLGLEVWTTDGTAEGTALLADVAPGASSSRALFFTPLAQQVFFFADDGVSGLEPHTIQQALTELKPRVLLPIVRR